jgi:hypothetical protein
LTKTLGETPVMVDVGDEQRNRPAGRTRLGDGCRRCVDEGVVGSEPTLLIEKNEMLLQAGRSRFNTRIRHRRAGFDNRKSERPKDARANM